MRLLERVGITARREPPRPVSAPAFRGPAAARDDRDGADVRPGAAHRRRADDRARRHRAGADPAPARRPAARVRHGARPHHPRPRRRGAHRGPGRGDVRGRNRRVRRRSRALFASPRHPYTRGLLDCIPVPARSAAGRTRSGAIPGLVPAPIGELRGCQFRNRCAAARCRARAQSASLSAGGAASEAAAAVLPPRIGAHRCLRRGCVARLRA